MKCKVSKDSFIFYALGLKKQFTGVCRVSDAEIQAYIQHVGKIVTANGDELEVTDERLSGTTKRNLPVSYVKEGDFYVSSDEVLTLITKSNESTCSAVSRWLYAKPEKIHTILGLPPYRRTYRKRAPKNKDVIIPNTEEEEKE